MQQGTPSGAGSVFVAGNVLWHAKCEEAAVIFIVQIEAADVVLYVVDPHAEAIVPHHEGAQNFVRAAHVHGVFREEKAVQHPVRPHANRAQEVRQIEFLQIRKAGILRQDSFVRFKGDHQKLQEGVVGGLPFIKKIKIHPGIPEGEGIVIVPMDVPGDFVHGVRDPVIAVTRIVGCQEVVHCFFGVK